METVLQGLGRKSVEAEDLRGQVMPQWNLLVPNRLQASTWRDEFNVMQGHVDRHVDTLNEIREAVTLFQNWRNPGEGAGVGRVMANPYRALRDVEQAPQENGIVVETDSEDEMDAAPDAPPDTRPLITPALHVENPALRENGILETDSDDEMDAAPDAPPDTRLRCGRRTPPW